MIDALLDAVRARGFSPKTAAMDKGYDASRVYAACERSGVLLVIPLRATPEVARGGGDPPICAHGIWRFGGSDRPRQRTKWRCPSAECPPRQHLDSGKPIAPLIPRESARWRGLYRGRAAVGRAVGRLKGDYGLTPIRVSRT